MYFEPFIVTRHKVLLFSEKDEPGIVFLLFFNNKIEEISI